MEKVITVFFELKEITIENGFVTNTRVIDSVGGTYDRQKGRIVIDSIVKIDKEI